MDNKLLFAPIVLRVGICLVYFWFGASQVLDPGAWTIFLPSYTSLLPAGPKTIVLLNGISEVILALMLLVGWKVRFFAALLAIHAFHIMVTVGYSAIGVRDFGIFAGVLSVALHGADKWSWDTRRQPVQITI